MSATLENTDEGIIIAVRKTKNNHVNFKTKQRKAMQSIVCGKDIIAVLPTGFGMSLNVYQLHSNCRDARLSPIMLSPISIFHYNHYHNDYLISNSV